MPTSNLLMLWREWWKEMILISSTDYHIFIAFYYTRLDSFHSCLGRTAASNKRPIKFSRRVGNMYILLKYISKWSIEGRQKERPPAEPTTPQPVPVPTAEASTAKKKVTFWKKSAAAVSRRKCTAKFGRDESCGSARHYLRSKVAAPSNSGADGQTARPASISNQLPAPMAAIRPPLHLRAPRPGAKSTSKPFTFRI